MLQALMFVRDLDTSLLGQNEHGLEQFDTLRKCTDELVNAILHVRQLLKRRRFEGDKAHLSADMQFSVVSDCGVQVY